MITLQKPEDIQVSPTTEQLLSQVTLSAERINKKRPFPSEIATLLRNALLPDRIVATLNMEGIVATRRQTIAVMDAMRINESIGKAEKEIFNTLKADEFVSDLVEKGPTLSEGMIRELNKIILNEILRDAGSYRKGPVELPGAPFDPPEASDVPDLVRQLCMLYVRTERLHPILQSVWLHAQFTLIHPFNDGNGRGGRLLQDWALIRRGYLPVGIPPSQRDDYYAALESSDKGDWSPLVELVAQVELSVLYKAEALVADAEQRSTFIQKLASAASQQDRETRYKKYLVWRKRLETLTNVFSQTCKELDSASSVIGAELKDYGALDFQEWETVCQKGHLDKSWLFSIVFFAEGKPFYKSIAYAKRHVPLTSIDVFPPPWDAVGLYFTGTSIPDGLRPDFWNYQDPHIKLREVLFLDEMAYVYLQSNIDNDWEISEYQSDIKLVESLFSDMFSRKAGIII
jgi:Fic family protein